MGERRKPSNEMKLTELARRSGVPERTIRLYITKGLIPRPLRAGQRAAYGPAHLEALERIRTLQAKGHSLAEIRQGAEGVGETRSLPKPTATFAYQLASDVRVEIAAGIPPWRQRRIQRALDAFASLLQDNKDHEDDEERNSSDERER